MKTIQLTLIALLLSLGTTAQNDSHVFDIRAYGGVSILQATSDNNSSLIDGVLHQRQVSGRPGVQAGIALTYGNRFFIQPGFQWSKISTRIVNENTIDGTELTDETSLNVISVPLKVGMRLMDPRKENLINLRIFGGIDGHHVTSVSHSNKSGAFDDITADDYSNLIVNADFGLGLDLWIFFLDAGYQLGLTPMHNSGDNAKANSFYTNFGLKLTFGE